MNELCASERAALGESVSRFLDDRLALRPRGQPMSAGQARDLWQACAGLGWTQALAGEQSGGLGLGMCAALTMAEHFGRKLLDVPVSDAMIIGGAVGLTGRDSVLRDWLSGRDYYAVLDRDASAGLLAGYAIEGAHGLALRWADEGLFIDVHALQAPSFGIDPLVPMARPVAGRILQSQFVPDCSPADWDRVCVRRRAARVAEILGAGREALQQAVSHACEREQFGRPIGVNQAIQHTLANDWMALDDAGLALDELAAALDQPGIDCRLPLAAAELLALQAAAGATAHALQVFGAMGMTWECSAHLYLKRVRHLSALLGRERNAAGILDEVWNLAG